MASWIIDKFCVIEGSSFLYDWDYAQVLVDENGNITYQNVPHESVISDNCISDYSRTNRRYKNNQEITRFCNYETHTEYIVKAQNCKPFAYVETNLDAPKCGYQTPLEKPADPPNPFGTLVYRPYKFTEFCDQYGNECRVDILKKYNFQQPARAIMVDSFIKPGSFFPQVVTVFVDRIDHTVFFNGSAQNDLNSNRTYLPDELITELCDYETGTNLKVYAQSATPFAYIVEELEASQCMIPDVDPVEIENWGSPVILDYKSEGDNKNPEIIACECTLNLLSGPNFSLQDLYTEDERQFQVVVTRADQIIFKGFIIPDSCQEPFVKAPYEVSIKATDGIGALKTVTYTLPIANDINITQRFIDIIAFALAPTDLNLNIRTICNVYETKMLNALDNDSLTQASVSPLRFAGDNGAVIDCYEVLKEVAKVFKATIYQSNGEWKFERRSEYSKDTIRSRVYNNKALFLYAEELAPIREFGQIDSDDIGIYDPQPDLYRGNAYKRVEVLGEFGKIPTTLFNGNFELWDGQNFRYWTKYGDIQIERVQKTIAGSGGVQIPIGNFGCKFLEKARSDRWLQASKTNAIQGDIINLSITISGINTLSDFKLRVKLGKYYLFNELSTTDYKWVTSLATTTIRISSGLDVTSTYERTFNISFPEAPESGEVIIQLYGAVRYDVENSGPRGSNSLPRVAVESALNISVVVDDISLSKNVSDDNKLPKGVLYLSEQLGYYTKKPDQETIIFSDLSSFDLTVINDGFSRSLVSSGANPRDRTNGTTVISSDGGPVQVIKQDLYAIYTADGSYSTLWYEYGSTSGRLPIGLLLAKSILKDYQKSYWYASGNYIGDLLSFNNSFVFALDCEPEFSQKVFIPLSATFDIKASTMTNVNLVEIFDKYIKSTDISTPSYPGDVSPPIVNNPNTPPQTPTEGIFTDEFSPEFY